MPKTVIDKVSGITMINFDYIKLPLGLGEGIPPSQAQACPVS